MKKLLFIIPFAIGATACVPMYGANGPHAGYPPYPYRGPYGPAFGVASAALPIGRWDNVIMQPEGAWLDVLTADGRRTAGALVTATNDFVRLRLESGEVDIASDGVLRVDRFIGGPQGPESVKRDAATGAAFGAGVVGVLGLVAGRVPPARLFAAGAIAGAYQNAEAGRYLRSSTIIYLAPAAARR